MNVYFFLAQYDKDPELNDVVYITADNAIDAVKTVNQWRDIMETTHCQYVSMHCLYVIKGDTFSPIQ